MSLGNIERPFKQLGEQINSLPPITIGQDGFQRRHPNSPPPKQVKRKKAVYPHHTPGYYPPHPPNPYYQYPPQQPSVFNPHEQKVLDKLKKWGLILAVAAVVGYAVYRMWL